jgi:PKD repeat protein
LELSRISDSAYTNITGSIYSDLLPLVTSGSSGPILPVASFSSNVTSGNKPLTIAFTDTSTGSPATWSWNFGDGTSATTKNPVHTYSGAGSYTVALTATNTAGSSNTTTKYNYITVTESTPIPKLVADFSGNITSGNAPLNVAFTDKSTGSPNSWKWSFGDGTSATTKNPVHTYSGAGSYTVTLIANNTAGSSNTTTKSAYIKVGTVTPKPVASFSSNATSGIAPLTVLFTSTSTNAASVSWNFGDGTPVVTGTPVSHTFTNTGTSAKTITVTLTATNLNNTSTKTGTITVNPQPVLPVLPVASFTISPTTGVTATTFTFTDTKYQCTNHMDLEIW